MECIVCRECFEEAIRLEEAARDYYSKMSDLFSDHPAVASIFSALAQDEQEHALTLGRVRDGHCHSASIHERSVQFRKTLKHLEEGVRKAIANRPAHLEEAYRFADRVEHSEVNEIYITLTTESLEPAGEKDLILSIIDRHLGRIRQLAAGSDAIQRCSIRPKET